MQFKDIIGQKAVKQRLINSVKENRVSHAQLFLGPEGSGNLAMAIAYAQYLVCENKNENDSCGTCPSCVKMNKLVHPDVTFSYPIAATEDFKKPRSVDFVEDWRKAILGNPYLNFNDWVSFVGLEKKSLTISVDECADIIRRLTLKSFEGGYKIIIMWLPEKLFYSAAPKLLKIIEEPPDKTLFLLVAEDHEQILLTIQSRTQLIKVNRISDAEMLDALMSRHELSREAARKIMHHADGNYREALLMLNNDPGEEDDTKLFLHWMRACYGMKLDDISGFVDQMSQSGREKQKDFLRTSLHIARECLLMNYADSTLVRFEGDELVSFKKFAPFVNQKNAERVVEELNKAHYHLERNANTKIVFTDLSFTMNQLLQLK